MINKVLLIIGGIFTGVLILVFLIIIFGFIASIFEVHLQNVDLIIINDLTIILIGSLIHFLVPGIIAVQIRRN